MSKPKEPAPPVQLPPRPIPPEASDCCGSGCTLCVFTLFERELERWQDEVDTMTGKQS